MSDFLSFDRFVTPSIIRVVFLLGLALLALVTAIQVLVGIWTLSVFSGVVLPMIAMCVLALLWRIYCELILVFFDMRDKLTAMSVRTPAE